MIYKISVYLFLPMLFIAFFLSILGVQQIEFGNTYYHFLKQVSHTYDSWKLQIPNIPKIPLVKEDNVNTNGKILEVVVKMINFFVRFFNLIIGLLNIIVFFINIIIQLLQFIMSAVYCVKDFLKQFGNLDSVNIAYV